MTMMDERLVERRRGVSEDKARKRLRWVLALLVIVLLAAGGIWLLRSPVLSISTVEITGPVVSDPASAVAELEMGVGTPTIDVDAGLLEERIERDPWVARASVSVVWPGTLFVDVVEHTPVAPVQNGNEWVSMAIDGSLIAVAEPPSPTDTAVAIDAGGLLPGEATEDELVLGALIFIDTIDPDLLPGLRIAADGGGLRAVVAGHEIRLGRPIEMATKAIVLESLIDAGLEPGARVDLIAPSRPAVTNPQPQVELEE